MDAQKELEALAAQVRHHEAAYRAGRAEISDGAFDELFDRYGALADELGVAEDERLDRAPGVDHTDGFVQVEHRTPMNQTPLIAAAAAGNVPLVEALLARGANPDAIDHLGQNALHWAMREAFRDAAFARGPFAALFERIAPAAVDVMADGRLVRLDRHLAEYFLFQFTG